MLLAIIKFSIVALLLSVCSGDGTRKSFVACLPADVKPEEAVSSSQLKANAKRATIKDTLLRLKAHCKKGKLIAGNGREIRFYRLVGCWGNPPDDYQEVLAKQNRELQRLKKTYTVIEIPCAVGDPRLIQ